ncbi:HAD hydrolase, family IA, variant 3 [Aphelenchoides bicaudatus]|nr:HAD hydrolase, family IA, variant 3 [Aphelenchoides bicaudatus]
MSKVCDAVIFDLDGLLIDTESLFSSINHKLLSKHGKKLTSELEHRLMGTKSCEAVRVLLRETNLEDTYTPDEYLSAFQAELNSELPNVKEMPGATKLINYFHSLNIPIGVCTGSNNNEFAEKTKHFQHWLDKIQFKVLGTDVSKGKPAPDAYLEALKRLNNIVPTNPENVLVFEDALNGATSAVLSNTTCILVSNQIDDLRNNQQEQLNEVEPKLYAIISSLLDFNPGDFDLPPIDG